jgi:hypothetical protein
MDYINIQAPNNSYILTVIKGLIETGWMPIKSPNNARLIRNGQLIILQRSKQDTRLRLFIYKVGGSSRGKPYERRIQITSTYRKGGLPYQSDYQDVVLGIDLEHNIFVGVDPNRMNYGGSTGNASSFFDREGLEWNKPNEILVRPRSVELFSSGIEYHAFFKPTCLAEYLLNVELIHSGVYIPYNSYLSQVQSNNISDENLRILRNKADGNILILKAPVFDMIREKISEHIIVDYEQGNTKELRKAKLSPEKLRYIKLRCEENGHLGEEFILNYERSRLYDLNLESLADRVKWISQESTSEGYDILSFEDDGSERWIEVKSTSGESNVFEMSNNEWETAIQAGNKYYIYRVKDVRSRKPQIDIYRNPKQLESEGLITKSASGWRIRLL